MEYGAIVIGGGHNGLICAAYLARAGLDTVVVERRSTVGGYASTESDLGARFNICNCDHFVFRSTPIAEELGLAEHGLEYLDLEPAHHYLTWGRAPGWSIFHDVERTLASLARSHPSEVEPYRQYLDAAMPVARLVLEMAGGVPTLSRAGAAAIRGRGAGITNLMRWSRMSAADVLRQFFASESLLAPPVATGPTVWGLSPYTPGTGLGALGYAIKHLVQGGRPVGGSGALTDAVLGSLLQAGGSVRSSTSVSTILCEEGRVRGVRLADGEEVLARTVVTTIDRASTPIEHVGRAPHAAVSMARRWRHRDDVEGYESKLDAVGSVLPEFSDLDRQGLTEQGIHEPLDGTVVVSPSLHELDEAHRALGRGHVSRQPVLLFNAPSVLDPTMSPGPGRHVLSLEVLYTPYSVEGGWANSGEPRRWLEMLATIVDNGDAVLDGIDRWRAMTPDRYERDFAMPKGHAASFAGTPLQALLGRPRELTRYNTAVAGLFVSGAASYPGAGVWGASGRNTARTILGEA